MSGAPDHWRVETLGRVLSAIEAGKNFRCIEKPPNDDQPGVVKVSSVTWGTFDELESKTCPDQRLFTERYLIRPGDFLISRANTLELVGACVVVGAVSRRLMLSDKILRLVMPEDLKRWVLWFLRSKAGRTQIEAKASGNQLSMRNIGQDGIRGIELPLAPPDERQRIVAAIESHFSRLDAATATLERVQRNLERYRASVLKAAVEGRLVPTEAELAKKEGRSYEPASVLLKRILAERRRRWEEAELAKLKAKGTAPADDRWKARYEEPVAPDTDGLPELPEGWCWTTLEAIAEVKGGLAKGKHRRSDEKLTAVPYLRVANVQRGHLDLSEVKTIETTESELADLALRNGDVLFNEGGDRDKLGRGWIWRSELPVCIHQNHVFRARLIAPQVLPEFVSWHGNSNGQRYFFDEGKHTTNLASLSLRKLRSLPVPLPPTAEQVRIKAEVERLLSLASEAEAFSRTSQHRTSRLRQSILKWAFEGRLVDQPPGAAPTTALVENPATMRRSASTEPSARR